MNNPTKNISFEEGALELFVGGDYDGERILVPRSRDVYHLPILRVDILDVIPAQLKQLDHITYVRTYIQVGNSQQICVFATRGTTWTSLLTRLVEGYRQPKKEKE